MFKNNLAYLLSPMAPSIVPQQLLLVWLGSRVLVREQALDIHHIQHFQPRIKHHLKTYLYSDYVIYFLLHFHRNVFYIIGTAILIYFAGEC